MDLSKYRRSGELSDLSVKVENQTFNLHKFPLFVRSDYFKDVCASSSHVTLDDFPGGASTFETIADYLYGKNVDVNPNNVVPIRCAIDYLKMNDDIEKQQPQLAQKSLVRMADAVLFDATHTAKAKRDFALPLSLLDQAIRSEKHAEAADMHNKIIDSAADSLAYYVKTGSPYDSYGGNSPYGYYDNKQPTAATTASKSPLNKEQMETLSHMPLKWMTEFIKSSQKVGLDDEVLAGIVKNYLDHNTGFNPNFSLEPKPKPSELISIAADILKVEKKLNDIADDAKKTDHHDHDKKHEQAEKDEKPHNLIKMAGDIIGDRSDKPQNLISMMSDILYPSGNKPDSSAPKSGSDHGHGSSPSSSESSSGPKSNLVGIMSDAIKPPAKPKLPKKNLDNDEKLKVITDVTKQLKESNLNPPFPMPWLMLYLENLDKLGADDDVKATFNKWATDALNHLNLNNEQVTDELSAVDPDVMVRLAKDVLSKDSSNDPNDYSYGKDAKAAKFIDLTDKYLAELNEKDALTPETFIKVAQAVPKEKRASFDNLMDVLLKLLKKNKSMDPETKEKLFKEIDFHKLSEKTLEDCKKSEQVPPQYIAEAALALCAKLRKELEESNRYRQPSPVNPSSHHYASGVVDPPRSSLYTPSPGTNRFIPPEVTIPSSSSNYAPRNFGPAGANNTHPRTRSIEPPLYANRGVAPSGINNQYSYPYQSSTLGSPKGLAGGLEPFSSSSSRGNKTVYPIPVTRSATESLGVHKPSGAPSSSLAAYCRDNATSSGSSGVVPPAANRFEHSAEFYSNDTECAEENNDYYYSASYSFSTIF